MLGLKKDHLGGTRHETIVTENARKPFKIPKRIAPKTGKLEASAVPAPTNVTKCDTPGIRSAKIFASGNGWQRSEIEENWSVCGGFAVEPNQKFVNGGFAANTKQNVAVCTPGVLNLDLSIRQRQKLGNKKRKGRPDILFHSGGGVTASSNSGLCPSNCLARQRKLPPKASFKPGSHIIYPWGSDIIKPSIDDLVDDTDFWETVESQYIPKAPENVDHPQPQCGSVLQRQPPKQASTAKIRPTQYENKAISDWMYVWVVGRFYRQADQVGLIANVPLEIKHDKGNKYDQTACGVWNGSSMIGYLSAWLARKICPLLPTAGFKLIPMEIPGSHEAKLPAILRWVGWHGQLHALAGAQNRFSAIVMKDGTQKKRSWKDVLVLDAEKANTKKTTQHSCQRNTVVNTKYVQTPTSTGKTENFRALMAPDRQLFSQILHSGRFSDEKLDTQSQLPAIGRFSNIQLASALPVLPLAVCHKGKGAHHPLTSKQGRSQQRNAWSQEEETSILNGMILFGKGKWREIKNRFPDKLIMRSPVNIKDKWRTMTRKDESLVRFE